MSYAGSSDRLEAFERNHSLNLTQGWFQELARLLSDQPTDFPLSRKSLSFTILFRVNQHAVALHIKDAAAPSDQPNI
jgi:hypothetical protein